MAASHGTAIAKAALSASLLRADPTPVVGDEIARLHSLFEKCITVCTPENIKSCKHWLLEHLVQSDQRITAFGKYLVALSQSFKSQASDSMTPSSRRRRLYILYLLNDITHHTTFYSSPVVPFSKGVEPFLKDLFSLAQDPTRKKQRARLENLLSIWASKGYYSEDKISELRNEVAKSFEQQSKSEWSPADTKETKSKNQQVLLPALHGDPTAPYHDLPATTMLPLMRPNSPTPINTRSVKPIAMKAGPPPKELADAVDLFIKNIDKMWYGGDMRELPDVDELGVDIIKPLDNQDDDEMLDDPNSAKNVEEGYYGWSRGFAIQMMKRRKGETGKYGSRSRERGRPRSYSRSLTRSRSGSRDRSRSYSRGSSRSRSRSRSSPRSRSHGRYRSRSGSRSRSRYRSSRRRRRSYSRSYSRSRSRSRSHTRRRLNSTGSSQPYSPRLEGASNSNDQHLQHQPQQAPPPLPPPPTQPMGGGNPQFSFDQQQQQQFPVPMQMPPEMAQFFQAGMPPPPPPPPPMGGPPPQMWGVNMPFNNMSPPGGQNFNQWGAPGQGNMYNNQPPPPPPPPPGSGGHHGGYGNQQYGRGGYHGRGGWNNRGGHGW
ncbi:hypothetical protein AA313_de0208763 [Arthrobotrys entomopaga]|nr:hypothetical protein AA313_de0208763 [Arthrobotrys entomopaga]